MKKKPQQQGAWIAALPLLAATLLALQSTGARADRPLVSETADALEKGSCVIDSAARRLRESGSPSISSIGGTLGCGLFGSTQMLLSYVRASGGGVSAHGLSLGGKTNLVEIKDGQTGLGVVYGIAGAKVSGGGGFKHDTTSVVGLASRELSKGVLGHANFGLARSKLEDKTRAVWALASRPPTRFQLPAICSAKAAASPPSRRAWATPSRRAGA